VTGNKADQIVYKRHSQRPGKLKEIPFKRVQAKFPERIIEHAVRGMLPKNKLGERMIRRLKVYAGEEHPHVSQLTWTEHRPERDAIAAVKAEEEADNRAENRRLSVARAEIAASAAAKVAATEPETANPKRGRSVTVVKTEDAVEQLVQPEQAVAEPVEAEVVEPVVIEEVVPEKKAPAKKPVAKRASRAKATTAKSGSASTTRKKPASSSTKASTTKSTSSKPKSPAAKSSASTSRKPSPTRKSPAPKKSESK